MRLKTDIRGTVAIEASLMMLILTTLLISISLIIIGTIAKEAVEFSIHESIEEMAAHPVALLEGATLIRQQVIQSMYQSLLEEKILSPIPQSFRGVFHFSTTFSFYNALSGEGRLTVNMSLKSLPLTLIKKSYYYRQVFRGDGEVNLKGISVYITKTGTKYHSEDCRCLRKSKYQIYLQDAKDRGYGPCKLCH